MPTSKLLENAIVSIQLGVEDFQSLDPRRPISAARNFFSGILLLAKEVLVTAATAADPNILLAAKVKPILDGKDGVKFVPINRQTIDFNTLGERLKDFGVKVDQTALTKLNNIRNDIEHRYTNEPAVAVRQALAKAFPVVLDLCRELGTAPYSLLGDAWSIMIGVKAVYESELAKCRATFAPVKWPSSAITNVALVCTDCNSELMMQNNPDNTDPEQIRSKCQSCGKESQGDCLVVHSVDQNWEDTAYSAAMGEACTPVHGCPSCALKAYVTFDAILECLWCGHKMGECALCECALTPESVSFNNESLCCYCEYRISKDD